MTSDDMNSQESRMVEDSEQSFFSELTDTLPCRQLPGVDRDSSYVLWPAIIVCVACLTAWAWL